MKKLLLLTFVCVYGLSVHAMEDNINKIHHNPHLSSASADENEILIHLMESELKEKTAPVEETFGERDPMTKSQWEALEERMKQKFLAQIPEVTRPQEKKTEQTFFQDCKNAIEKRDNRAADLLSPISSTTTRAQLIGLAKAQTKIDQLRVKQSMASSFTRESINPDSTIEYDYKNSMMVLAGLKSII